MMTVNNFDLNVPTGTLGEIVQEVGHYGHYGNTW